MTVLTRGLVVVASAALVVACGKKGPPLPPLRPLPVAPTDVAARVIGDRVQLRMVVPAASQDPDAPVSVARIDVYAYTAVKGEDAPPTPQLLHRDLLVGSIEVRPLPDENAPPPATPPPPDSRPAPGEIAEWSEVLAPDWIRREPARRVALTPPAPRPVPLMLAPSGVVLPIVRLQLPVRYYVAVAVSSRGRNGATSAVVPVRAGAAPTAPAVPTLASDATSTTLTWPADAGAEVMVYASNAKGEEQPAPLTAAPVTTGSWSTPVVFGEERCYTVRRVARVGLVSYDSPAAGPVCLTAKDIYPPSAPTNLVGAAETGRITIEWRSAADADVAGYHVLRAEGAGATLSQLTTTLETSTTFVDRTTRADVAYVYVVVAVDRAGNVSPQSAPIRLTGQ